MGLACATGAHREVGGSTKMWDVLRRAGQGMRPCGIVRPSGNAQMLIDGGL